MENKHNLNYFKKSGWQRPLGFGLLIVGILLFWLGWSYFSYILSVIFIPAGIALFLIGSSVRSTDEDIDEFIEKHLADFKFDLEEEKSYAKRILKHIPKEELEAYKFDDGLMFTKTKTGSVRSSEYLKSVIYVLSDGLYIASRTVSIVSGAVSDKIYELAYTDIKKVEIIRAKKTLSYAKRSFEVNDARLHIECADGSVVKLPVPDTLGTDQLTEKINTVKDKFISSTQETN